MLVQRVVMPSGSPDSWTVLDDDGEVIEPAERYLAYLSAIERSPNTVRAYAISLKLWFEFLAGAGLAWDEVGIEDVARFVGWLRAPAPNVVVLADEAARRRPSSINRYLAGVFGFYDHHARTGLAVASELVTWRRASRGSYKPFLHHVTKGRPIPVRPVKLAVPRRRPATLGPEEIVAVLGDCVHLRDRFLLSLLAETGMRVGQALGLRHSDFVSRERFVRIVPRIDNANGARAKSRSVSVVPVSTPLVRLYSEYMHVEYGEIDSDYVFVNLFGGRVGRPLTYATVHELVGRIAARTGISFTAHMLRHSHATEMVRQGVPIEVVAKLLTHRSSATTSSTYLHLDVADIRRPRQGRRVDRGRPMTSVAAARLGVVAGEASLDGAWAAERWDAAALGVP
ncbi:MAG: site-specific integrase, partial [Actinomycetota bacterium]|nr:site-specific integrase [Actinomycetota bacterium]